MVDLDQIIVPEKIESERLILRSPTLSDAAVINHAILETWEPLHQWMPWAKQLPSVQETEAAWQNFIEEWRGKKSFNMLMFTKDTSQFIGVCGIPRLDWSVPKFEIGYWLRQSAFGKGFMSEAVVMVTDFAYKYLAAKRIEIVCDSRNIKSIKVAERAGYQKEAYLKNHCVGVDGELRDTCIFACIRSEKK